MKQYKIHSIQQLGQIESEMCTYINIWATLTGHIQAEWIVGLCPQSFHLYSLLGDDFITWPHLTDIEGKSSDLILKFRSSGYMALTIWVRNSFLVSNHLFDNDNSPRIIERLSGWKCQRFCLSQTTEGSIIYSTLSLCMYFFSKEWGLLY